MIADWRGRGLSEIDDEQDAVEAFLTDLVRQPSVTGTDVENDAQGRLACVIPGPARGSSHPDRRVLVESRVLAITGQRS